MPETDIHQTVVDKLLKAYHEPGIAEVEGAMDKAREAAFLWRKVPVHYRVRYLAALRQVIMDNMDGIVKHLCSATGKVPAEALLSDVYPVLELCRYYERYAGGILSPRQARTPFLFRNTASFVEYTPLGVVLVIAPWNYPLQLSMAPLLSALTAGNAVILKPSEQTQTIGEMVDLLCRRAGLPQNLVQVLYGGPETARRVIGAKPDLVFFTGSLSNGRKVMEQASRDVIPVILELGSKNPMIVLGDAPFDRAVDGAVYGAFANAGQSCVGVERLYVQDTIYDAFVQALAERTRELRLGDSYDADIGRVANRQQIDIIENHVQDALDKGAKAVTPLRRQDLFYAPLVLKDVNHSMRIMQEETFGPVLPVMPFKTEDEAILLANETPYGLNASVWTGSLEKGRRIAARLRVGNCAVNDVLKNTGNPYLPFGGVKKSGFGRYHGPDGLQAFSSKKAVTVNTGHTKKEMNWFPYSRDLYETVQSFPNILFSDRTLRGRLRGLWRALRFVNSRERLW